VFPLPEIFIDAGIDEEDKPYISGNYWGSYFDTEIAGIPIEYQQVAEAFKSHRSGSNFRYTIPGLLAYASYEVTLGFAENYIDFCQVGSRQFNVTVNGKKFVSDLDVYDTVGCNTALVLKKSFRASPDGKIIIQFSPSPLKPMVAMIGVNPNGPIKSLTLIKAVNQTAIGKLGFGSVVDLEKIGTDELSIKANAISAVTRVRFRYNGIVHTEHVIPYAMNGGDGDHFFPVPYLAANGNKTIWIDAFNDDKDQSDTIRIDLTVTGAEIFEQESDDTVVVLVPSILPSSSPSDTPSTIPSDVPSSQPSDVPSALPSEFPSSFPSAVPSDVPSAEPSDAPSAIPSDEPSAIPSDEPSAIPSDEPSGTPSAA
jgi:Malectin domain